MAAGRVAKPFVRRGITFQSQYAYRQFLAAEKGFASPFQRQKAINEVKRRLGRMLITVPKDQAGALAADIADWRRRIGSFVEGQAPTERGSNRLPPEVVARIRSMGDWQWVIWRELYL